MSQNQKSFEEPDRPRGGESSNSTKETSKAKSDAWSEVKDPTERRKIQNKLAQRRFRDKIREQREESERESENQRRAGSSYASPEPGDLDPGQELSGLPWGGISMSYIVATGKTKEQNSQRSSRENSTPASNSNAGGSSR